MRTRSEVGTCALQDVLDVGLLIRRQVQLLGRTQQRADKTPAAKAAEMSMVPVMPGRRTGRCGLSGLGGGCAYRSCAQCCHCNGKQYALNGRLHKRNSPKKLLGDL